MNAETSLVRIAARSLALGGVVLLAAVPAYVFVEPPWRPLVARLAASFVLGAALLQIRGALVDRLRAAGASALDEARQRRAPAPAVPHHFIDCVSDIRAALRNRRYFEDVLWPRLAAYATRPLPRPRVRLGRGPSAAGLGEALAAIEKQP